jgi:hypothetical protein
MRLFLLYLTGIQLCFSSQSFNFDKELNHFCKDKKNCKKHIRLLNQLFYLSADNYGANGLLHPIYKKIFDKTSPGGLLVNLRNNISIEAQRQEILSLQKRVKTPFFFGGDNCQASFKDSVYRFRPEAGMNNCASRVRANLAKIAGCNFLFNPQIEKPISSPVQTSFDKKTIENAKRDIELYKKVGIILTLKHFPFTNDKYDNHKILINFEVPYLSLASNFFPTFQAFENYDLPIMTTHIVNNQIDNNIITFSKKWVDILRNDLGFKDNLVISDSINMFRSYPDDTLNLGFKYNWKELVSYPTAIFIRSILAGHDIVINRESSKFQIIMIKGLIEFLNSKHQLVKPLVNNIKAAAKRIKSLKQKYIKQLTFIPKVSKQEYETLMQAYLKMNELPESFCSSKTTLKIFKKVEVF